MSFLSHHNYYLLSGLLMFWSIVFIDFCYHLYRSTLLVHKRVAQQWDEILCCFLHNEWEGEFRGREMDLSGGFFSSFVVCMCGNWTKWPPNGPEIWAKKIPRDFLCEGTDFDQSQGILQEMLQVLFFLSMLEMWNGRILEEINLEDIISSFCIVNVSLCTKQIRVGYIGLRNVELIFFRI